jgi:A/G-specific adenine glycosylase
MNKPLAMEPAVVPDLRHALLTHYDRFGRDLPWRESTDPYRVLISEFMLQQTRVATVERYYDAWLERFPDLQSLASAEEDDVLKAWEGMGYYRRAKNLRKAAVMIVHEHGGVFPATHDDLSKLPGVGAYTAGAIASIAFGEVVPAVDGNVKRVLARVCDEVDPRPPWLKRAAERLVDPERPGDWNQALMELGATICTPRRPKCSECPVQSWCQAKEMGTQLERPSRRTRAAVRTESVAVGVFHDGHRVLLVRRPDDGLLGGMWAFPELPSLETVEASTHTDLFSFAREHGLSPVGEAMVLPEVRHKFTHIDMTYRPGSCRVAPTNSPAATLGEHAWINPAVTTDYAIPVAQRKILDSWMAEQAGAGQ